MRLGILAAAAAVATTAALGVATPSTAAESAFKPPKCTSHYGNTAVWADCTGQGSKSWVKLTYVCETPWGTNFNETDEWPLGAREHHTLSAECTFKALRAGTEARPR
ncbi:hypothetical protein AB0K09_10025 [Streptomyces sp. NPDC049577]|uniref:hypothetical protein n=1 Tax=Streptomyces sp. NPDC049577 TaxID=3155153 RepID=UPI003441A519